MKKIVSMLLTLLVSGCLLESVGRIDRNIKPFGAHWVKEGMTRESRIRDSWACGATQTEIAGLGPIFSDEDILNEKKATDKNEYGPRGRLFDKWGQCMQSKGYSYLKDCDDRCLYP